MGKDSGPGARRSPKRAVVLREAETTSPTIARTPTTTSQVVLRQALRNPTGWHALLAVSEVQRHAEGGTLEHDVSNRALNQAMRHVDASSGRPLDAALRERFEIALDHDLGHVRIHTDGQAEQAAELLNAHAFALGADLFMGRGELRPGTPAGDRLLAHELTHVVQHDQGRIPADGGVSSPTDALELEAVAMEGVVVARLASVDQVLDGVSDLVGPLPSGVRDRLADARPEVDSQAESRGRQADPGPTLALDAAASAAGADLFGAAFASPTIGVETASGEAAAASDAVPGGEVLRASAADLIPDVWPLEFGIMGRILAGNAEFEQDGADVLDGLVTAVAADPQVLDPVGEDVSEVGARLVLALQALARDATHAEARRAAEEALAETGWLEGVEEGVDPVQHVLERLGGRTSGGASGTAGGEISDATGGTPGGKSVANSPRGKGEGLWSRGQAVGGTAVAYRK